MQLHDTPLNTVVKMVKNYLGLRFKDLDIVIKLGHEKLRNEERNMNPNIERYKGILINEDLVEDISRKLRTMRKITLKSMCFLEKNEQEFVRYCEIIYFGIYEYFDTEDSGILDKVGEEILQYKKNVQDYIAKQKSSTTTEVKEMIELKFSMRLIKLNELIYDFLSDANTTTYDDWRMVEGDLDFDKYVIVRRHKTFYMSGNSNELTVQIVEAPVEKKIYCFSIGTHEDLEINVYPTPEHAITGLLDKIHANPDLILESIGERTFTRIMEYMDGSCEKKIVHYDSLSSISKKIESFLNHSWNGDKV